MEIQLRSEDVKVLVNQDLKSNLLTTKNKIDDIPDFEWRKFRSLVNKYEGATKLDKQKHISRAYFKLKELMIDDSAKFKNIKRVAALAEGPGGFIKYINDAYPTAEVFGISLKEGTEGTNWLMGNLNQDKVKIIYGDDNMFNDGNIYNRYVADAYVEKVGKNSVDLVTADGGFQAKDENDKEVEHMKLFLAETLIALRVLKKGGSFILKIYDIFTQPTLEMLYLLKNVFKSVQIKKPVSSRPANSERYIVCHGYQGYDVKGHVNNKATYSSILKMPRGEREKFTEFVKKLGELDAPYIQKVIDSINEAVTFYHVNKHNRLEISKRKKEQKLYKTAWEQVYN